MIHTSNKGGKLKVVIEQEMMKPEKNNVLEKKMDFLEKKLDAQYKAYTSGKDYIKLIQDLNKSFMGKLDKLVASNKSINNQRVSDLRKALSLRLKNLNQKSDVNILKSFASKLSNLEKSVTNITMKPSVKVINRGPSLNKAFDTFYKRMEEVISKAGPRMMPSPS